MLERVWAVDTITGDRLGIVPTEDFPWTRKLNDAGDSTCTIDVRAVAAMGVNLRSLIKVHRVTLVYEVEGCVVDAGTIKEADYEWATGKLTVTMGDLWDVFFEKRLVLNRPDTSTGEIPGSKLDATILSLQGLAKWYIDGSVNLPPGWPQYDLPITLPATVTGTAVSRTIYGYELRYLADALRDLMEMEGGPDIAILPRWAGGFVSDAWGGFYTAGPLVWDIRMADTWTYPAQTTAYHLAGVKSGVKSYRSRENGDIVATRALAAGEGSEKKLLLGNAFTTDDTYPALEVVESSKNEKVVGRLNAYANEVVRTRQTPTKQQDMVVSKNDPEPGRLPAWRLQLGATVRVRNLYDPWLAGGWSDYRIIELSGDLATDDITLTLQ